jgi:hypothetical protein
MELSLLARIFVKTSLLTFCLVTYCVSVVPSFFVRVIIIGREISIFILLRWVKGGGGGGGGGGGRSCRKYLSYVTSQRTTIRPRCLFADHTSISKYEYSICL